MTAQFFTLNGKYQVSPDTTANDLHNDIGCWLECVKGTLGALIAGVEDAGGHLRANPNDMASLLYGARHFVELIEGAFRASCDIDEQEKARVASAGWVSQT